MHLENGKYATRVPDVVRIGFARGKFPSETLVNKGHYTCSGATISVVLSARLLAFLRGQWRDDISCTFGSVARLSTRGRKNSWLEWDPRNERDCIMDYFGQMGAAASEPWPGFSKPDYADPGLVKFFSSISRPVSRTRRIENKNTALVQIQTRQRDRSIWDIFQFCFVFVLFSLWLLLFFGCLFVFVCFVVVFFFLGGGGRWKIQLNPA